MAKRFLELPNRAAFDTLEATLRTACGYPKNRTTLYAEPTPHPTNSTFLLPITDEAEPFLTALQRTALKDVTAVKTSGFFPAPTRGIMLDGK